MPYLLLILGALSDSSSSKYRRRFWIILSTVALVISTLTLAYCQELAEFFVTLIGVGAGDWTEEHTDRVRLILTMTTFVDLEIGKKHVHRICNRLVLHSRLCSQWPASLSQKSPVGYCPAGSIKRRKRMARPNDQCRQYRRIRFWYKLIFKCLFI